MSLFILPTAHTATFLDCPLKSLELTMKPLPWNPVEYLKLKSVNFSSSPTWKLLTAIVGLIAMEPIGFLLARASCNCCWMLEKCFRFSSWLLWHRLSSSNAHLTSSCCYLAPLRENIMKVWVLKKRKTCQVITLQYPCDLVNAATSLIISLCKLKSLAPHINLAVVLSY